MEQSAARFRCLDVRAVMMLSDRRPAVEVISTWTFSLCAGLWFIFMDQLVRNPAPSAEWAWESSKLEEVRLLPPEADAPPGHQLPPHGLKQRPAGRLLIGIGQR